MTVKLKDPSPTAKSTLLVFVVDRSGSMAGIADDMSGGINQLFADQAKVEGECLVTLTQFDDTFETLLGNEPVGNIESYTLIPRGSTALFDAVGRTIAIVDRYLATAPKPEQVIVTIVTDGNENASREFTQEKIKSLIDARTEAGWKFTYLGANQDAILVGQGMGIPTHASMDYAAGSRAVRNSTSSLSSTLTANRSGLASSVAYSGEDRAKAVEPDPVPSTSPK